MPADFLTVTWKVIIWDILNALGEDYQIVFKRRVKLPTIIYIISR